MNKKKALLTILTIILINCIVAININATSYATTDVYSNSGRSNGVDIVNNEEIKVNENIPSQFSFDMGNNYENANVMGGTSLTDSEKALWNGTKASSYLSQENNTKAISSIKENFSVKYTKAGQYNGQNIDVKITVMDFDIFTSNTQRNAFIGFYTKDKMGVYAGDINWVAVRYEFFKAGTNEKIEVSGNTTYSDIKEYKGIHFINNNKDLYVNSGSKLKVSTIDNGLYVYDSDIASDNDYITETFTGSEITRVFTFTKPSEAYGEMINIASTTANKKQFFEKTYATNSPKGKNNGALKIGDKIIYEIKYTGKNNNNDTVTITEILSKGLDYEKESSSLSNVKVTNTADGRTILTWTTTMANMKSNGLKYSVVVNKNAGVVVETNSKVQVNNQTYIIDSLKNPVPTKTYASDTPSGKNGKAVKVGDKIKYSIKYANVKPTKEKITIVDKTSVGLKYIKGSSNYKDPQITKNSDGTSTLKWVIEIEPNKEIELKYSVKVVGKGKKTSIKKSFKAEVKPYTPKISIKIKATKYTGEKINANTASIELANKEKYNGSITYTYYTDSSCKTKTTTDNGAAFEGDAPKKVGQYYVKASIEAFKNYTSASSDCTSHVILNNEKAIVVDKTTLIYDGNSHGAKINYPSGTTIATTYYSDANCTTKTTLENANAVGGEPRAIGTYYVIATVDQSSNSFNSSGCQEAVIIKPAPTILTIPTSPSDKTYTGSNQESGIVCPEGSVTGGTTIETDQGTYTQTCTLANSTNYQWSDGTTEVKEIEWKINRKAITIKAKDQTITYGSAIDKTIDSITGTGLVSDHHIESILLEQSTEDITTNGKITASGAIIEDDLGNNMTQNYDINYSMGNLTIKQRDAMCPTLIGHSSIYDANNHSITVGSDVVGGTVEYRTSETEEWTTTKPTRKEAGTTTVYVQIRGNDSYNTSDCGSTTITISKSVLHVKADDKFKIYGENNPTLTYTYSGEIVGEQPVFTGSLETTASKTSPLGNYDITQGTLNITDGTSFKANNYSISFEKGTLRIGEQELSIPESPSDKPYTGNSQSSGIACPSGSVASGDQSATNPGTYTQTCTITDTTKYKWSDGTTTPKDITWKIVANQVTLQIPTSPSDKTYTGNNQTSGITCPNGSVASGDQSATNPGTYTQTCTIENTTNYKWNDGTTTPKDITWKIVANQRTLQIPTSPSDKIYTGNNQSSGIVCPNGSTASGTQSETNVGTYTQTCTLDDTVLYKWNDNTTTPKTIEWKINAKTLNIPTGPGDKLYTGSNQTSGITCPSGSTASGDQSATDVGTYTQTCTLTNTTNYKWNDGTTEPKAIAWKIVTDVATLQIPTSPSDKLYTGNSQSSGIACPEGSTASGDQSATNPGTYTQTCTIENTTNYKWSDGTTTPKDITWKIVVNQATLQIPLSPSGKTYTGSNQTSGITCPNGSTASGTQSATNAGTYSQTCTLTDTISYKWNDGTTTPKTIEWKINTRSAAVSWGTLSWTYDGKEHSTTATATGASGDTINLSISNNSLQNKGTKNVTASCLNVNGDQAKCDNYVLINTNETIAVNAKPIVILVKNQTIEYGYSISTGLNQVTVATLAEGDELTAITLTPSIAEGTITASNAVINNSSTITDNYSITYMSGTLTVIQRTLPVPSGAAAKTYTGSNQSSGIVCPEGSTASGTQSAINAGTYTQTCTLSSALEYKWSDGTTTAKSITWKINPKTLTVTAVNKTKTYGTANPALTYTYSGQVSGQTPGFTGALATTATTSSAVGAYPISKGTLALTNGTNFIANNYTMSFVQGTLTISQLTRDRIHFLSNGTGFNTFILNLSSGGHSSDDDKGNSPSETILLESNGHFALIDTGLSGRAAAVKKYLDSYGVTNLDFILITHHHYDHIGGAKSIIEHMYSKNGGKPIKVFMKKYATEHWKNDKAYSNEGNLNRANAVMALNGTKASVSYIYSTNLGEGNGLPGISKLGDMDFKLYNTFNLFSNSNDECKGQDGNVNSIITYITVNNRKILLTGDMEPATKSACPGVYKNKYSSVSGTSIMNIITKNNTAIAQNGVDVLKLPHHGYGSCDITDTINKQMGLVNSSYVAKSGKYIVTTNWSSKIKYYYQQTVKNKNGKIVYFTPYQNIKSCKEKAFKQANCWSDDSSNESCPSLGRNSYYVNDKTFIFDFTNGGISISESNIDINTGFN